LVGLKNKEATVAAIAIVTNLNAALSAAVKAYFAKFSVLPPKNLKVDSTTLLGGPTSLENLMDAMIKLAQQKEFVVITHGFEDGSGLYLKLVTRGQNAAGKQAKHDMLTHILAIAARTVPKPTADDATKLEITEKEIERLIDKMKRIHAMTLTTIEVRGCNLGRNVNSVAAFRKFFGAASFGAPKLHSFFGLGPAKSGDQIIKVHSKVHTDPTIVYTQTFSGKNCHCCIGLDEHRKPMNGHVVADDEATMNAWIQANFNQTATLGKDANLPTHGLWFFPPINTNDPIPIVPDPRPMFPLQLDAQGNNEYALNVVYSP
jgi:hypothetical protein